jgi:hypothetical protein
MNNRNRRVASVVVLLGSCVGAAFASEPPQPASPEQIIGTTYRVEAAYYVECHVPNAEVDKVLQAVAEAVRLEYGKYDQVAFIDAPGLEQFRPLEGSKAGQFASAGRAPTTNVSFSVPRDPVVLKKALDAIHFLAGIVPSHAARLGRSGRQKDKGDARSKFPPASPVICEQSHHSLTCDGF